MPSTINVRRAKKKELAEAEATRQLKAKRFEQMLKRRKVYSAIGKSLKFGGSQAMKGIRHLGRGIRPYRPTLRQKKKEVSAWRTMKTSPIESDYLNFVSDL